MCIEGPIQIVNILVKFEIIKIRFVLKMNILYKKLQKTALKTYVAKPPDWNVAEGQTREHRAVLRIDLSIISDQSFILYLFNIKQRNQKNEHI